MSTGNRLTDTPPRVENLAQMLQFQDKAVVSRMLVKNTGRIGRSPGAVARISRILSSISWASDDSAMRPAASARTGNDHPRPTNSCDIRCSF